MLDHSTFDYSCVGCANSNFLTPDHFASATGEYRKAMIDNRKY